MTGLQVCKGHDVCTESINTSEHTNKPEKWFVENRLVGVFYLCYNNMLGCLLDCFI